MSETTIVQVADLERMILKITPQTLTAHDRMCYYRLCGAMAAAGLVDKAQMDSQVNFSPVIESDVDPQVFKFRLVPEPFSSGYSTSLKVSAIKLIRQLFGYGLKEAKEAVEDPTTVYSLPLENVATFKNLAEKSGISWESWEPCN